MRFFLNPTCKETTELLTKRDTVGLSWYESLRMKFHLAICRMCRAFDIQVGILNHALHQHIDQSPTESDLSSEAAQRISDTLQRELRR
jgi:hypothetical protein